MGVGFPTGIIEVFWNDIVAVAAELRIYSESPNGKLEV